MATTDLKAAPPAAAGAPGAKAERAPKHRGTAHGPTFNLRFLPLWDKVALAALAVAAAVLSLWNLDGAPSYQDDEGTYTSQAFAVHSGTLAPYTYWYDHPPLGWIQIASLNWLPNLLGLGDGTSIGATRYVISVYFVASALLLYMVARRLGMRIPFAALTTVLFILSPLSLVLGRQIYLDNIGVPWLLLAFYLALSSRDALWHHVGAGICFAVAVLSKETLSIFGPALLLALMYRPKWSNRLFSVVGFLTAGGLLLAFYPLSALLRNELLSGPGHVSLQDALAYQLLNRSGSGTIFEAGSSRAELLAGWLYFDKYLIAAGLVAAVVCLLRPRSRILFVAIASFATPIVLGQGYLPAMYIIGVIPFLALACGSAVDIAWSGAEGLARRAPGLTRPLQAAFVAVLSASLLLMSVPQWFEQDRTLLTAQTNSNWRSAMTWVQDNVSRSDVVLAPYSMWHDLNSSGWNNAWTMIATEKPDLDKQYDIERPGGWREIRWIIVGPSVTANIDSLGLSRVKTALQNSEEVQTFGEWSVHRVINPPST
ncbi:ArnT family glycosyltransferase [Arthrobacter sp. 9MFCol3.1]|uniref:ArnT family glycosyltransferase n=1 Tax=Arthrobacter sp. 9MFCol3.1 TaxID=1150398 RepID=UPI00047BF946|nr:glycosyltransferase family 39 protein [Arthrobacter sp. 9MFCol3.1]